MAEQPAMIPGDIFEVSGSGDQVTIKVRGNRGEFTLTVQEYEQKTLDTKGVRRENMEYPTQYTLISYTLSPEPEQRIYTINDLSESDQPRPKQTNVAENTSCCCAAAIGIIGGADGPTAIVIGTPQEEHLYAACSALHFETVDRVTWDPVFRETVHEPLKVTLI